MSRFRNVFVLNSGRCGSMTFVRACGHISNYSAGHETLLTRIGRARLDYPVHHIEADNRLSWLLGRLQERYGQEAFYVHLRRDPRATARSFARRSGFGIMKAYREGLLLGGQDDQSDYELALDYLETVDANIRWFLADKLHCMTLELEHAATGFARFWERVGAHGDRQAALAEWRTAYNASEP